MRDGGTAGISFFRSSLHQTSGIPSLSISRGENGSRCSPVSSIHLTRPSSFFFLDRHNHVAFPWAKMGLPRPAAIVANGIAAQPRLETIAIASKISLRLYHNLKQLGCLVKLVEGTKMGATNVTPTDSLMRTDFYKPTTPRRLRLF